MQYRPEIDGLRAVAVIPVILFHAGFEAFSGGFVGVDVFFVISGYLITSIIVSELDSGTFTLRNFYERRARRILPALFFVIACCIPVAWFTLTPNDMKNFAQSVFAAATFSSNILFWRESGYFATAAELKPLLHTWSLAVEEQYYILFPLFMILAWRYLRALVPALLALVFILSFSLSQYAAYNHPAANFYLLPTRGWELLIGVFIALYIDRINLSERLQIVISYIGIGLISTAVFTFSEATPFPSVYALLPTVGAALVILGGHENTLPVRVLKSRVAVYIGLISYSLYLWHQPIFAFLQYSLSNVADITKYLTLVIIFALANLTYFVVEKPFRRFNRRKSLTIPITSLTLTTITAFVLSSDSLQRIRFNEKELEIFAQYREQGAYVVERFNELTLADFDELADTTDVLIIGDSYAQDLVNILYENQLNEELSLSTHYIPARCGNVFTEKNLVDKIAAHDRAMCAQQERYDDHRLLSLIKTSEQVWLASSWKNWQVTMLGETVKNIRELTDAQVVVFGIKSFGERSSRDYRDGGVSNGLLYSEREVQEKTAVLMNEMAEKVPQYATYIDVQIKVCGSYVACSNTINGVGPLSYDGGHLTRSGAEQIGKALTEDFNALLAN